MRERWEERGERMRVRGEGKGGRKGKVLGRGKIGRHNLDTISTLFSKH